MVVSKWKRQQATIFEAHGRVIHPKKGVKKFLQERPVAPPPPPPSFWFRKVGSVRADPSAVHCVLGASSAARARRRDYNSHRYKNEIVQGGAGLR